MNLEYHIAEYRLQIDKFLAYLLKEGIITDTEKENLSYGFHNQFYILETCIFKQPEE